MGGAVDRLRVSCQPVVFRRLHDRGLRRSHLAPHCDFAVALPEAGTVVMNPMRSAAHYRGATPMPPVGAAAPASALETYRRQRFARHANADLARLRRNRTKWADYQPELQECDATLDDGLEGE
jgi:hypothetical protein